MSLRVSATGILATAGLILTCALAGVAAAVRTRRRRASYANTYGASGGIAFTIVQVGCSGLLLLGGIGLMILAIIFQR